MVARSWKLTALIGSLKRFGVILSLAMLMSGGSDLRADDKYALSHWHKQQLSDVFFSEGAGSGDFNKDGKTDIVAGPFWYEGPEFKKAHAYGYAQLVWVHMNLLTELPD